VEGNIKHTKWVCPYAQGQYIFTYETLTQTQHQYITNDRFMSNYKHKLIRPWYLQWRA